MKLRKNSFASKTAIDIEKVCRLIIVCTNDGTGMQPRYVRLPHQIYLDDIMKLRGPSGKNDVCLIPVTDETISLFWGKFSYKNDGVLSKLLDSQDAE